ncbi:MAG: recombination mediator RecR, partial [Candidatus Zixiibacteriota bacterium]
MKLPRAVDDAIDNLTRLPGIGERSAQRLVFWLIGRPDDQIKRLSNAIVNLSEGVKVCSVCGNISEDDPCEICSNEDREDNLLCIVEEATDMLTIEKSGAFQGQYHVLGGAIDPINDIHPEDLNIQSLIDRVGKGNFREIILATDPNAEGNITATYLRQKLKPFGVKISRIAQGISYGSGISYANERSLKEAFSNRI